MGLFGDIVGDALGNVFSGGRTDKKLEQLGEEGELVPATIYAIRCASVGDSGEEWTYDLDLATTSGPLRAAVRQQLIPDPWRAPLGGHVLARHLDGKVAIDWPATLDEAGVEHHASLLAGKTLKAPFVMGMPTQNMRLELRLDDDGTGRDVVLAREYVPPYAHLLAAAGGRVPVAVDPKRPDRVTVDWPAAAMAAAGAA